MKLNPGTICLHLKHFLLCINCRCICGNSIIIIIIILISQHQPGLSDHNPHHHPHHQPHQMIIIIFTSNDFNLINSWGKAKPLWMWRWPQRGRMSSVTRWWSMIMVMILMMMWWWWWMTTIVTGCPLRLQSLLPAAILWELVSGYSIIQMSY